MRRFLTMLFMFLLFIAAVAAASIFGYLYITTNSQVGNKNKEIADLQQQKTTLEQQLAEVQSPDELMFIDEGLEIELAYPADWQASLDTVVDASGARAVVDNYEVTFSKNSAALTFEKILGGVGGNVFGLPEDEFEVVEVNEELVRYRALDDEEWSYVASFDCDEVDAELRAGADVCVESFFPGFGAEDFATILTLSIDDEDTELLEVADQIAAGAVR